MYSFFGILYINKNENNTDDDDDDDDDDDNDDDDDDNDNDEYCGRLKEDIRIHLTICISNNMVLVV